MPIDISAPSTVLFASRGLFIVPISDKEYVVQDVIGHSSMPFPRTSQELLAAEVLKNFGVRPLVPTLEASKMPSKSAFQWGQLEHWYVAHLDYALTRWLCGDKVDSFYQTSYWMPIAYLEVGYGEGDRQVLEIIDKTVRQSIKEGKLPLSDEHLETWLVIHQFNRACSELMSLLHRATDSFVDLLLFQRDCVPEAVPALAQFGANEVCHRGRDSHRASTAATMTVVSLCTSLDIQSKLLHYLDQIDRGSIKFRPARGRHFSDLEKLKPRRMPVALKDDLLAGANSASIKEMIQFRHDIVHSTSAIELEKIYVGFGTREVNEMPLHYCSQRWRDCVDGQPERYLGRDYFTGQRVDIECRIYSWIMEVLNLHLASAARIHEYLSSSP